MRQLVASGATMRPNGCLYHGREKLGYPGDIARGLFGGGGITIRGRGRKTAGGAQRKLDPRAVDLFKS